MSLADDYRRFADECIEGARKERCTTKRPGREIYWIIRRRLHPHLLVIASTDRIMEPSLSASRR
jgi:hypothetical protein